jgi:hypothetical protein
MYMFSNGKTTISIYNLVKSAEPKGTRMADKRDQSLQQIEWLQTARRSDTHNERYFWNPSTKRR